VVGYHLLCKRGPQLRVTATSISGGRNYLRRRTARRTSTCQPPRCRVFAGGST